MTYQIRRTALLLGTFVSLVIDLCNCDSKPLDGYKFSVYTTESCPRNHTEWSERSSAINCTESNGYLCLPSEDLTELLEFCYFDHRILIEKGLCMFLRKRDSIVDAYRCRNFVEGCPNSTYRVYEAFKYKSCVSIGNGCFLAEPTCIRTTTKYHLSTIYGMTTSIEETDNTMHELIPFQERNDWVWILTLLGVGALVCVPVIMFYLKMKSKGDATLLVISSLNALVNQTITISCLFETGQKGALFQFPDNTYCAAQYCSMTCGKMSLDCPNNQTYRLNATVSLSWHKKQFYCGGIFGGQQSNLVTLDIKVPVSTLILSPTKLSVNSGKNIYLECQTNYCNPPSTVIWYINGEKVAGHVNVTIDTSSTGLSRTTSVLQYSAVTSDDGNPIFCTASNIEGLTIQSRTQRLDVRYISDVQIIPAHNVYVTAGTKRVLIHCYVENANPETIEYQWFKGTSSNLSLISYSQTLVLKTVDKKDGGQYCCRATNAVGASNSTIQVIIQYTPLAAKIIDVICLDSRAFLLWTSSYTNSSDDIFEEKLQYKRYEDKLFESSDNQNWNRTNNHCKLTKITGLEQNSKYVFRVLTSNKYGSVYSNNGTCVTGAHENQDLHKTKNAKLVSVIGGLFGGFVFIVILIAMGAIFKTYIKAKQNSDKESLGNKDRSAPYEDQFCGEKDHQYDGIVSTTAGNIELYSTVS